MLNLQIIRQFQAMSKGTEARDFNLIKGNFSYVQTWSMIQIAVVIICTIVQVRKQNLLSQKSQLNFFQVQFVKRLFQDPRDQKNGGSLKMRT